MARTTFTSIELKKFGRDNNGGHATFFGPLTQTVMNLMGWDGIPECYAGGKLTTELAARQMELTPNDDALVRHAITLDTQKMHSFEVVRRELEGKRDKGTRLELVFKVDFADAKGCRKLEEYKLVANKSKLCVDYEPAAVQENLPGTEAGEEKPPIAAEDTGCVSCNAGIAFEAGRPRTHHWAKMHKPGARRGTESRQGCYQRSRTRRASGSMKERHMFRIDEEGNIDWVKSEVGEEGLFFCNFRQLEEASEVRHWSKADVTAIYNRIQGVTIQKAIRNRPAGLRMIWSAIRHLQYLDPNKSRDEAPDVSNETPAEPEKPKATKKAGKAKKQPKPKAKPAGAVAILLRLVGRKAGAKP